MTELAKYQTPEERQLQEQKANQPWGPFNPVLKMLQKAKNPKFIGLVALLLILVILIVALNLASKKPEEEVVIPPLTQFSPTPEPSVDTSIATITRKVESYNANLDQLKDFTKTLNYPIVDLDIDFEK